jgi:hypothetical protein
MYKPIPQDINEYLSYDSETGIVTWKNKPAIKARVKVGDETSSSTHNGYKRIKFKGCEYRAHRICWFLHYGEDPGDMQIDHINGVRDDNRICNLRLVTNQQNQQNTDYLGVSLHKRSRTWRALIRLHDDHIYIGNYPCPLLAGIDYLAMKSILHPQAAR